jgi:hypothetical protein
MHKPLLAALIVGTSALSIPAFAQVHLGGAAQVGAGVNAAAAVPGTIHAADQTGMRANQTLHRADQRARHVTHRAMDKSRPNVNANAAGSMNGGMAGANVDIGAGVNATNAAGNVGIPGQGVGDDVRGAAHSAIGAADRSAGSVGNSVRQTATGQSVGADAKVNAGAAAHGH